MRHKSTWPTFRRGTRPYWLSAVRLYCWRISGFELILERPSSRPEVLPLFRKVICTLLVSRVVHGLVSKRLGIHNWKWIIFRKMIMKCLEERNFRKINTTKKRTFQFATLENVGILLPWFNWKFFDKIPNPSDASKIHWTSWLTTKGLLSLVESDSAWNLLLQMSFGLDSKILEIIGIYFIFEIFQQYLRKFKRNNSG